jgi:hypothetical protein
MLRLVQIMRTAVPDHCGERARASLTWFGTRARKKTQERIEQLAKARDFEGASVHERVMECIQRSSRRAVLGCQTISAARARNGRLSFSMARPKPLLEFLSSFRGVFTCGRSMFVADFTVFVSRVGMPFGVFMLAHIMMVSGLMVVMSGSMMVSRCLMMMLASGMR